MLSVPSVPLFVYVNVTCPLASDTHDAGTQVPDAPSSGPLVISNVTVRPGIGVSSPSLTVAVTVCVDETGFDAVGGFKSISSIMDVSTLSSRLKYVDCPGARPPVKTTS